MGKSVDPAVLDAALNDIKNNTDQMHVCNGEPADYAGVVAQSLASVAMAPTDFTGPANALSGRELEVAAKAGLTVNTGGVGDHVALVDAGGTRLIYVTTISNPQTVVAANTMDLGTWKINMQDPV